jgi:hypothetical protein
MHLKPLAEESHYSQVPLEISNSSKIKKAINDLLSINNAEISRILPVSLNS